MKVLLDLVREHYPVIYKAWDHYSYNVHSPISLDDLCHVEVALVDKCGHTATVRFGLVPVDQEATVTR